MLNEHEVEEPSACSEGKTIFIVSREDMHEQSQNLIYKLDACKINSNLLDTGLTFFFCARKDINYSYA